MHRHRGDEEGRWYVHTLQLWSELRMKSAALFQPGMHIHQEIRYSTHSIIMLVEDVLRSGLIVTTDQPRSGATRGRGHDRGSHTLVRTRT